MLDPFMQNLIVSLHHPLRVCVDVGDMEFQLHSYFPLIDIINGLVGCQKEMV